jgi:hypothetical protein
MLLIHQNLTLTRVNSTSGFLLYYGFQVPIKYYVNYSEDFFFAYPSGATVGTGIQYNYLDTTTFYNQTSGTGFAQEQYILINKFPYLPLISIGFYGYNQFSSNLYEGKNHSIYGYEMNSFFVSELSLGSHNYSISCYNITNSEITNGLSYFNSINTTIPLPTFKLDSFNYNCSFNNCSLYFIFNSSCNMTMTLNSINYNSNISNTNHNFFISPLSENTIYLLNYNAYGNYSYNVTGTFNIQTKSYSELLYNDSIKNNDLFTTILILVILFVLYLISEIFKISMLGTLAGIGVIIYSFTLFTYGTWFFIIIIFSGLTMLARSIFA